MLFRSLYEKKGINYDYYGSLLIDNYQTVDNLFGKGRNQPYYDYISSWEQGNTIVSSAFNMGYFTDWQKNAGFENSVLVINNAQTLSGIFIGNYGGVNNSNIDRWLAHDDSKKGSMNNWISTDYLYSDGCFVTTRENQKKILEQLASWNLTHGYQIRSGLYNTSYYRTPFGGR